MVFSICRFEVFLTLQLSMSGALRCDGETRTRFNISEKQLSVKDMSYQKYSTVLQIILLLLEPFLAHHLSGEFHIVHTVGSKIIRNFICKTCTAFYPGKL